MRRKLDRVIEGDYIGKYAQWLVDGKSHVPLGARLGIVWERLPVKGICGSTINAKDRSVGGNFRAALFNGLTAFFTHDGRDFFSIFRQQDTIAL